MIKLKDREFLQLVAFIKDNFGVNLIKKRTLIEGRLNNYLVGKGYTEYGPYLRDLFNDPTGEEINIALNYLTTNYSYFMREWDHFEYYSKTILPEWTAKIKNHDLRVWCAASSTGEEPYTIAIVTDDFLGEARSRWDSRILATDISERVLQQARLGTYSQEALEKVPAYWKARYFKRLPDSRWQVTDELKKQVLYRRLNLMDKTFPFKKRLHVVFCRNVMIYFDAQTKVQLVNRIYNALEPGGYLIVGQSESVDRTATRLRYVQPSIYRKDE